MRCMGGILPSDSRAGSCHVSWLCGTVLTALQVYSDFPRSIKIVVALTVKTMNTSPTTVYRTVHHQLTLPSLQFSARTAKYCFAPFPDCCRFLVKSSPSLVAVASPALARRLSLHLYVYIERMLTYRTINMCSKCSKRNEIYGICSQRMILSPRSCVMQISFKTVL